MPVIISGIPVWRRNELKLLPPKALPTLVPHTARREIVIHYSTGQELGRADTRDWWRAIQKFHMGNEREWNDIGYNFGVDIFGNIFEGRGWIVAGAHSPGHNTSGIGIVFLGNDDPGVTDVTPAARAALNYLIREAHHVCGHALEVKGHRETQRAGYTSCPGDELMEFVRQAGWNKPSPSAPQSPSKSAKPYVPRYLGPLRHPPLAQSRAALMWQRHMATKGWEIAIDGLYGPRSVTVCKAFQQQRRLVVDGVVGPKTWTETWRQ